MTRAVHTSHFSAGSLARSLRALHRQKAPESLLPAVLRRVGLADTYWKVESPIGTVFIAHSKAGISMVSRASSGREFEREFFRRHGRAVRPERSAAPKSVRAMIQRPRGPRAFERLPDSVRLAWTRRQKADIQFDLRGLTEFERAVLKKALEIPPGEVRPYSWIAKEIGAPGAVRAAGSALAKNPVPLLIPCHRVVRSDGHIGKYSLGGSVAKRKLLEAEGAQPRTLEILASEGVRYLGNASRRFYCFPTCGGVSSLLRDNVVRFTSDRQAQAAGYHPCEDCRPLAIAS